MDPNEALRELRDATAAMRDAIDNGNGDLIDAANSAADLFAGLDEWLTRGGFPPAEWAGPGVGIPPDVSDG